MREYDLHRQRRQQRTVGLASAGLEKGGLFVLKKTVVFALIKAVWFALRKAGWLALKKAFCSPLERRFVRFEKSGISVFKTVGCVRQGAYALTRIGGSPM